MFDISDDLDFEVEGYYTRRSRDIKTTVFTPSSFAFACKNFSNARTQYTFHTRVDVSDYKIPIKSGWKFFMFGKKVPTETMDLKWGKSKPVLAIPPYIEIPDWLTVEVYYGFGWLMGKTLIKHTEISRNTLRIKCHPQTERHMAEIITSLYNGVYVEENDKLLWLNIEINDPLLEALYIKKYTPPILYSGLTYSNKVNYGRMKVLKDRYYNHNALYMCAGLIEALRARQHKVSMSNFVRDIILLGDAAKVNFIYLTYGWFYIPPAVVDNIPLSTVTKYLWYKDIQYPISADMNIKHFRDDGSGHMIRKVERIKHDKERKLYVPSTKAFYVNNILFYRE